MSSEVFLSSNSTLTGGTKFLGSIRNYAKISYFCMYGGHIFALLLHVLCKDVKMNHISFE